MSCAARLFPRDGQGNTGGRTGETTAGPHPNLKINNSNEGAEMEPTAWGAPVAIGAFILAAGIVCLIIRVRADWQAATAFIEDTKRSVCVRNSAGEPAAECPVCGEPITLSDHAEYDPKTDILRHMNAGELERWS